MGRWPETWVFSTWVPRRDRHRRRCGGGAWTVLVPPGQRHIVRGAARVRCPLRRPRAWLRRRPLRRPRRAARRPHCRRSDAGHLPRSGSQAQRVRATAAASTQREGLGVCGRPEAGDGPLDGVERHGLRNEIAEAVDLHRFPQHGVDTGDAECDAVCLQVLG